MTATPDFLPLTPDELAVIEAHARQVAGTIPGNVDAVEKLRLIATLRRAEEAASEDAAARAAYAATREEESVPVEVVDTRERQLDALAGCDLDAHPRRQARDHRVERIDVDPDDRAFGERRTGRHIEAREIAEHEDAHRRRIASWRLSRGAERELEVHVLTSASVEGNDCDTRLSYSTAAFPELPDG